MRHGSVCSGAGGMDLGFHQAGSTAAWLCEFDPWRRKLLAKHWPGVPIHPDLSELNPDDLAPVDLLIGGTPCQDLSVAGRRAGLDGERSGLFWDYMRIRNALNIEWCVWENVAGALSSNDGLDFASVLGAMVGADVPVPAAGWAGAGVVAGPWGGACWRLLDAQYFGVPQRRRRVFVVGRLGGPCPPEVLLELAGGDGDSAAGSRPRPRAAGALAEGAGIARSLSTSNTRLDGDTESFVVGTLPARGKTGGFDVDPSMAADGHLIAAPLTKGSARSPGVNAPGRRQEDDINLVAYGVPHDAGPDQRRRGTGDGQEVGRAGSGDRLSGASADADGVRTADGLAGGLDVVAVSENQRAEILETPYSRQLTTGGGKPGQGYPMVRIAGEVPEGDRSAYDPQPDGRRYAACGDGVVAPVAEWIGRRLAAVIEAERQVAA